MLPPPSGGGTLQAYRNSNTGDLVFLSGDDVDTALAPIGTTLNELSCVKGQNNVTVSEQYDFGTSIDLEVNISRFIEYTDPSSGISTIYGFDDSAGILYNMTNLTNIVQLANLPELNNYEMFSITPDGIFFKESFAGPYKLLKFDYSTLISITPSVPSLESTIQRGIFYVNNKYFVFAADSNNYYLLYSSDLSIWGYTNIGNVELVRITYVHDEYIIQYSSDNVYGLKHSTELVSFDQWVDIQVPTGLELSDFYNSVFLIEMYPIDIFIARDTSYKARLLKVNSDFSLSGLFPNFALPIVVNNLFSLGTKIVFTDFVGYQEGVINFYSYDSLTEKLKVFQTIMNRTPAINSISSKLIDFIDNKYPAGVTYTRDSSSDITL